VRGFGPEARAHPTFVEAVGGTVVLTAAGNGSRSEFRMFVTAVFTAETTGALAVAATRPASAAPAASADAGLPEFANSWAEASAICTAPDSSSSPA
jgi:hypothetical protein